MKRSLLHRGGMALTLVALAGATGCGVNSPVQTAETMDPSDGVNVDLGDVDIRSLALVGGRDTSESTLTGAVENSSSEAVTLTVGGQAESVEIEVPAGEIVQISGDGETVSLGQGEANPGDVVELAMSTGADETTAAVPLLEPHGYYEEYAPEGWTPSPTESEHEEGEGGH